MRYIIAALLIAGAAWGYTTYLSDEILPAKSDYKITIYGNEEKGFIVSYEWKERRLIGETMGMYEYDIDFCSIGFEVDSLTDIRPTPAEMGEK